MAFVVNTAVGLDTNSSSSDYVQLHSGDKATLAQFLGFVQQTAAEILGAIQPGPLAGQPGERGLPAFH